MLDNLLCNPKNCIQSTVYVTAQSVWIILYIALLMGVLNTTGTSSIKQLYLPFIMGIISMIVFLSLIYMFINYLCKKGYGNIAWVVSVLPFISAIIIGYNLPKHVIKVNSSY